MKEITYQTSADNTMQPALFHDPGAGDKRPLLVGLHTWSNDWKTCHEEFAGSALAVARGWIFIHPDFRGPNLRPEACGSELVIKDITSAVDYARANANVDESRIYLLGASGGGHAALLMAGRAPSIWAGVSAWVPASDLKEWFIECKGNGSVHAEEIVKCCSGDPVSDSHAAAEAVRRSPVTYLKHAKGVPLDINGGISDDLVSFAQSLWAFNAVAAPRDRISEPDIAEFVATKSVPRDLAPSPEDGKGDVIFRRQSGQTRLTIFNGGHTIHLDQALAWLERQHKEAQE